MIAGGEAHQGVTPGLRVPPPHLEPQSGGKINSNRTHREYICHFDLRFISFENEAGEEKHGGESDAIRHRRAKHPVGGNQQGAGDQKRH